MPANIFPAAAPSYTKFGLDLTSYLGQPESYFQVNRYGFDTGKRIYMVNTDLVTATNGILVGEQDIEFPEMFVDSVNITKLAGPWSRVEVGLLGLIQKPKPIAYTTDAEIRLNVPIVYGITIYGISVSLMTVQTVTVTDIDPGIGNAGVPQDPPIYIPRPSLDPWPQYFGLPAGAFQVTNILWLLERRSVRFAGGAQTGGSRQDPGFLTGSSFTQGAGDLTGVGSKFTTQLQGGNIVVPQPSLVYHLFSFIQGAWYIVGTTGFLYGTVQGGPITDTHAYVSWQYPTSGSLFPPGTNPGPISNVFSSVRVSGPPPGVTNQIQAPIGSIIWEVTDSFKRLIAVNGAIGFIQ